MDIVLSLSSKKQAPVEPDSLESIRASKRRFPSIETIETSGNRSWRQHSNLKGQSSFVAARRVFGEVIGGRGREAERLKLAGTLPGTDGQPQAHEGERAS